MIGAWNLCFNCDFKTVSENTSINDEPAISWIKERIN